MSKMKLMVEPAAFLRALKTAGRAVGTNNTLPVLDNIFLQAENGVLTVMATNLELSLKTTLPAEVEEDGKITVPAKTIVGYVSLLPQDSAIKLTKTNDVALEIKAKKSKTKIKGIPAEDFPAIPQVNTEESLILPASVFKSVVKEVAFSAEEKSSRPVLSGVLFDVKEDTLTAVATDSYRLSERIVKLEKKVDNSFQCLIPVRSLQEAERILGNSETIQVLVGKNQILFRVGATELTNRLIDGKFPNYKAIIPQQKNTTAIVKRADLDLAVRRVSLFSRENNQYMKFDFDTNGHIQVLSDQTDIGEDESAVSASVEGQGNIIALNSEYMLAALSALSGVENIRFEIQERMNPSVIKIEGRDDFLHLIMPLKV